MESVNGKQGVVVLTAADIGALPDSVTIPTKTSELTNDSGFVTDPNYVHTDNNFTTAEKTKLSDIQAGAQANRIDDILRNGVLLPISQDGNYPKSVNIEVPEKTSDLQNDSGFLTAIPSEYVTDSELQTALAPKANTADLAEVATSGDYADLTGKPTIPTVPTNVSAFTNDAGYINASQAPVQSVNGQTGAVTTPNTTYTISISGNVITLTPSSGTAQSITLPVYGGGVI